MSKARIIHWIMLAVILTVCYATIYYQTKIISAGQIVYVPLVKEQPFTMTNRGLELNFKDLIQNKRTLPPQGKIVVYVNSFGVISFSRLVGDKSTETLAFGEHFLDYNTYRKIGLYADHKPQIFFGARYLPLSEQDIKQNMAKLDRTRYLILKISDSGFAIPVGLADRNYGSILRLYK